MAVLLTSLASRTEGSCVCHGASKDHLLLPANPMSIPSAAATVVRKTDPKEQITALVQAGQKALGWVEENNLKEVVFEFRAEDLDLDICEPGDGDVYAYLMANGTNPPVVKITCSFEGVETDVGKEEFKEKGDNWVAVWKFKGGPGVYSFEFTGEIEDRYEDHPASDDPKDLDIQGFRSQLAVSVPVEVDIVSDQTDDAMPWNCSDPSRYAKIVTTLSPEGAVGAFTLKIMDGTAVVRTLVAGENRAGGTWTDAWNGLKDDGTPADAKAYTIQADWVVPDAPAAGDQEYPVTLVRMDILRKVAGTAEYIPFTEELGKVLPGQKIDLKLSLFPEDLENISFSWEIPGKVFKDYVADNNRATLTGMHASDLSGQAIQYYWADSGESRVVACSVKLGDSSLPASALFFVQKPVSTLTGKQGQAKKVTIEKNGETIELLALTKAQGEDDGISFAGQVSVPSGSEQGGKWLFLQIVKVARYRRLTVGGRIEHPRTDGVWALDSVFPYSGPWDTDGAERKDGDNPSDDLPVSGYDRMGIDNEKFRMFVMFLPPEEEARLVPVRVMEWEWEIEAQKVGGTWTVVGNPYPAADIEVGSEETSDHPVWTINASPIQYNSGSLVLTILPETVREGDGLIENEATIEIPDPLSVDVLADLASNDETEIKVPKTVNIPHGQTSVFFNFEVVDDAEKDGSQVVTISASTLFPGYTSTEDAVVVDDNE